VRFKDFISEAPRAHANERVQLIDDLLRETDSNHKMKLSGPDPDAAIDEAVKIMSRVARGADGDAVVSALGMIKNAMQATRKAIMPFPTWMSSLEDAGVWIDHTETGKVIANLQAQQMNIMNASFFLHDLQTLIFALHGLWRLYEGGIGHDGRMGTNESERAFLRAGFKKLGIIE
jgi:hypothetical protein